MQKRIGILGGGQLGLMIRKAASNPNFSWHFLDPDPDASCRVFPGELMKGNFRNRDKVLQFAEDKDMLGIEIEHVSTEALEECEKAGKIVIPSAGQLSWIQDKGHQKTYFARHGFPTLPFELLENGRHTTQLPFPYFLKCRKGGYDGYGVQKISSETARKKAFTEASVAEKGLENPVELAIILARDKNGRLSVFPPVSMEFEPNSHMVSRVCCPANIPEKVEKQIQNISEELIKKMDFTGILAVEFFWDGGNGVYINELAPRVHNSGHISMDVCNVSQFEQYVRILEGEEIVPVRLEGMGRMLNLQGAPDANGVPDMKLLQKLRNIPGVRVYWYEKKLVKPYRKMGHINLVGRSAAELDDLENHVRKMGIFISAIPDVSL